MVEYLAHIRKNTSGEPEASQTVAEHCRKTAEYAAQALEPAGLFASGFLAGLIHDAGKMTSQFQNYLIHGTGARGSVNHTFAGTRILLNRWHNETYTDYNDVVSELLSFAAGAHHGLFDCVDERQKNGFEYRLHKDGIGYDEASENFFRLCASPAELNEAFQRASKELVPLLQRICDMTGEDADDDRYDTETAFYSGLLARLLLSAVIDGDRRDTAEFMNAMYFPARRDRNALIKLWGECLCRVEEKLDQFPHNSEIDRARRDISNQCRNAAEQAGGVFRLNVPTGGGKTLSSLRFALAHAKKHGKQRIIFTSPLLSILDQTADTIHKYVQNDSIILEHHSNLVQTKETPEALDHLELLTENWQAPLIITTLVQLLNTLFSGRTSAIRRFHALCNSVIIIDEVQTVPGKMLSLFSLAVNFLAEICGATVVLCSATQPCIEQIEHPLHTPVRELVPYSPDIWQAFQRTVIQNTGEMSLEELSGFALTRLETAHSLLIICNKKSEAEFLFHRLEDEDIALFQLSAAMCMAHRRNTLDNLCASLKDSEKPTVCVSTQVIEAGIDISFSCVIRLAAGMDSVVQAAGRCNRNGENGPGIPASVYLIQCSNEQLSRLPDIQRGKDATLDLLAEFQQRPEYYGNALDSNTSIQRYYSTLYRRMPAQYQDFNVGKHTLLSFLAQNEFYTNGSPRFSYLQQAFRTAGSLFEVFEQNTVDVIVPYEKGTELIADLCSAKAAQNPAHLQKLLEASKPYTIPLYRYQIDRLEKEGGLIPLNGGATGLNGHYDKKTGFSLGKNNLDFLGVE